jgi:hypothetical protein
MRALWILIITLLAACGSSDNENDLYLMGEWSATLESTRSDCGGFPPLDAHFIIDRDESGELQFTDLAWTDVNVSATFRDRTIIVHVVTIPTIDPRLDINIEFIDIGNGAVSADGGVTIQGTGFPGGCLEPLSGIGIHYQE